MRRASVETIEVSKYGDQLAQRIALGELDPDFVVEVLEPFATERRRQRLQQVFADRLHSVTVVMDSICDPHNIAALLRTSEAHGVARIHIVAQEAASVAYAGVACGTNKWVEVRSHRDAAACVRELLAAEMVLVAAHPQGDLEPRDLQTLPRLALVLGNEHSGIGSVLSHACQHTVRVPMRGLAESLNVSVSGGILLSHAVAGRSGDVSALEQRKLYARGLAVTVPHAADILDRAARETRRNGRVAKDLGSANSPAEHAFSQRNATAAPTQDDTRSRIV